MNKTSCTFIYDHFQAQDKALDPKQTNPHIEQVTSHLEVKEQTDSRLSQLENRTAQVKLQVPGNQQQGLSRHQVLPQ
jgi:hypothetical protein